MTDESDAGSVVETETNEVTDPMRAFESEENIANVHVQKASRKAFPAPAPPQPAASRSPPPSSPCSQLKTALDSLPASKRKPIMDQYRLEGQKAAQQWLESPAGQRYLVKQVAKTIKEKPEMALDHAKAITMKAFIASKTDAWMSKLAA